MLEFRLQVRVYLEDTDAQGVVYNASYFRFMERARTEWLREQGIDHDDLRDRYGVMLLLSGVEARFKAPARLSDMLFVAADVTKVGGTRIIFDQSVTRNAADGELVCAGTAEVACVDVLRGKPKRFPGVLLKELKQ